MKKTHRLVVAIVTLTICLVVSFTAVAGSFVHREPYYTKDAVCGGFLTGNYVRITLALEDNDIITIVPENVNYSTAFWLFVFDTNGTAGDMIYRTNQSSFEKTVTDYTVQEASYKYYLDSQMIYDNSLEN